MSVDGRQEGAGCFTPFIDRPEAQIRHDATLCLSQHYAGPVSYRTDNLVLKNKEQVAAEQRQLLGSSSNPLLQTLFGEPPIRLSARGASIDGSGSEDRDASGGGGGAAGHRWASAGRPQHALATTTTNLLHHSRSSAGGLSAGGAAEGLPPPPAWTAAAPPSACGGGRPAGSGAASAAGTPPPPLLAATGGGAKGGSVTGQFRRQLSELIAQLQSMQPHFVRCIKPNAAGQAGLFDPVFSLQQLKCGGVMEAIRISCAGLVCGGEEGSRGGRDRWTKPGRLQRVEGDVEARGAFLWYGLPGWYGWPLTLTLVSCTGFAYKRVFSAFIEHFWQLSPTEAHRCLQQQAGRGQQHQEQAKLAALAILRVAGELQPGARFQIGMTKVFLKVRAGPCVPLRPSGPPSSLLHVIPSCPALSPLLSRTSSDPTGLVGGAA